MHVCKAMVTGILEVGPNEECRVDLKKHQEPRAVEGFLEENVHVCRVSKTFAGDQVKLSLMCSECRRPCLVLIVRQLKMWGADWKFGAPPRSLAERSVEQLLRRLDSTA
jgi:hypothetical protein